MYSTLTIKSAIKYLVVLLFLMMAASTLFSSRAEAANVIYRNPTVKYGDGCYDSGTLMNVVVYVAFRDENGNDVGFSDGGFNATISTTDGSTGLVWHFGKADALWRQSRSFNPGGEPNNYENCNVKALNGTLNFSGLGDKNVTALTFEGLGANNEDNSWKMSCGGASSGREFNIVGTGTPRGIPAGYTAVGWGGGNGTAKLSEHKDNNVGSFSVVLIYRIQSNPTWSLTPATELKSSGSPLIGDTITFNHKITNNGPDATQGVIDGDITGATGNDYTILDSSGRTLASGNSWESERSVTATSSGQYCSNTRVSPIANDDAGSDTKGACVNVRGWTIGVSSNRDKDTINVGETVKFTHTIINNGPSTTNANVNATASASSGVTTPSSGVTLPSGSGQGGFVEIERDFTPTTVGVYCESVSASPKTDNDSGSITSSQACVNVNAPAKLRVQTFTPPDGYEKGSGSAAIRYELWGNPPCGPTASSVSVGWGGTGKGSTVNDTATVNADASDCSDRKFKEIPQTIAGNVLDIEPIGSYGPFNGFISSPASLAGNYPGVSFTIYEAPFARFFGGDVMICGDGPNNRFIYDSASPSTSSRRGSFSEYASIYLSNNNPRSDYQGLNSASLISSSSWYDYLKSYWNSADLCDNGLVPSDDITVSNSGGVTINATNYTTSRTIYNSNAAQAITINGNISVSPPSDPTDPKTYNVVLIYSAGDINITSNAGSIEAILIAEGTIRTCSDALSATDLSNVNKCVKPLKITGAVSAGTVKLQRTGGTRFKAQDNNNDRSVRYLDLTSASEIIEYPWYLSYVNLDLKDRSGNNFDAYFSLPPRL
jgi:hypothetical protein